MVGIAFGMSLMITALVRSSATTSPRCERNFFTVTMASFAFA